MDVLDAGAAPAVDGLVVVADREHPAAVPGQQPQPGVLDAVGVLELVDQDMAETGAVVFEDLWPLQPELVGAQQDLGEVDQPGAPAQVLVGLVDLDLGAQIGIALVLDVLRPQALVLAPIDEPLDLARRPA